MRQTRNLGESQRSCYRIEGSILLRRQIGGIHRDRIRTNPTVEHRLPMARASSLAAGWEQFEKFLPHRRGIKLVLKQRDVAVSGQPLTGAVPALAQGGDASGLELIAQIRHPGVIPQPPRGAVKGSGDRPPGRRAANRSTRPSRDRAKV